MFELRLQDPVDARETTTKGITLGRFATHHDAAVALTAEEQRLDAQLLANNEGAAEVRLHLAVVQIQGDNETGWIWSSYQPAAAH